MRGKTPEIGLLKLPKDRIESVSYELTFFRCLFGAEKAISCQKGGMLELIRKQIVVSNTKLADKMWLSVYIGQLVNFGDAVRNTGFPITDFPAIFSSVVHLHRESTANRCTQLLANFQNSTPLTTK
jgi:hypothetical protein